MIADRKPSRAVAYGGPWPIRSHPKIEELDRCSSRHTRAPLNSRPRREVLHAVAQTLFARFTTPEFGHEPNNEES